MNRAGGYFSDCREDTPNTVSVAGWQQLGLPKWMAERIEKYRSKGGQFRRKEDLLKIYDFPPDLYDQLEPYIALKETPRSNPFNNDRFGANKPFTNESYKPNDRPAYPERPAKPILQPFDINTADTTQLMALETTKNCERSRDIYTLVWMYAMFLTH